MSIPPPKREGWRGQLDQGRDAAAFLTVLPIGTAGLRARSMTYFPVAGAGIGTLLAGLWAVSERAFGPLPAAAVVVAGDALITGALHLDGLADAADGLLAHDPAKARLDIMAEPGVGAFACVAVGLSFVLRTSALAAARPSASLLAATYCSSRSLMVLGSRWLPYARTSGLASAWLSTSQRRRWPFSGLNDVAPVAATAGLLASTALATARLGGRGALSMAAGVLAGSGVLALGRRRLGGYTGDVLGAAGVVCETATLLIAATAPGQRRP